MIFDFPPGSADEGEFQVLPIAILIWRYMQRYHSGLPSAHDVVTGFWQATDAETAVNLKGPRDFCTLFAQVAAADAMRKATGADAKLWQSEKPATAVTGIADGSLAEAAFMMVDIFDLYIDEDVDATCAETGAWPEPEDGTYVELYMDIVDDQENNGKKTYMPVKYHTVYSAFQEGDVKRALMDVENLNRAENKQSDIKDVREANKFSGLTCIYWDNYDNNNPQPWKMGDCALMSLFLNDDYYEC